MIYVTVSMTVDIRTQAFTGLYTLIDSLSDSVHSFIRFASCNDIVLISYCLLLA